MNESLYNNFGICALSIAFSAKHVEKISLQNALLIAPLISHRGLLQYLARKGTLVTSIEQLIVKDPLSFANFNARFYAGLTPSINAVQFLIETGVFLLDENRLKRLEVIEYSKTMGKRAGIIYRASKNIANIVEMNPSTLYNNLRIEL